MSDERHTFSIPCKLSPTVTYTHQRDNNGIWEVVVETLDRETRQPIGEPKVTAIGKTKDLQGAGTKYWDALSLDDRVKLDREMSPGRPPYVLMPGKRSERCQTKP